MEREAHQNEKLYMYMYPLLLLAQSNVHQVNRLSNRKDDDDDTISLRSLPLRFCLRGLEIPVSLSLFLRLSVTCTVFNYTSEYQSIERWH